MADLPRSVTAPARMAIDCWSGVALLTLRAMPLPLVYMPLLMVLRKLLTFMESVTPLAVRVAVAVVQEESREQKAESRNRSPSPLGIIGAVGRARALEIMDQVMAATVTRAPASSPTWLESARPLVTRKPPRKVRAWRMRARMVSVFMMSFRWSFQCTVLRRQYGGEGGRLSALCAWKS